uniref:MSP domain-containing protein n=1 Tax=Panagrolaimus sp. ES5 TaxID=591445 RepID=A0AC34FF77_9BILA
MATKDYYSLADNPNIGYGGTSNNQNSNLNLNHNNQTFNAVNVQSKRAKNNNSKIGKIAAIRKLLDLTDSNNLQAKRNSNSWNKSKKHLQSKFLNLNHESEEQHGFDKSKSANSSTISLHIAAYENLNEDTSDSDGTEKEGSTIKCEKTNLIKKWEPSKPNFTGSSLFIKNPFEFPRQQRDHDNHPEVMQFKKSQRLRNPNGENPNVNERNNTVPSSVLQQQKRHQKVFSQDKEMDVEESNVDATLQEDHYSDNDVWSDEDDEEQENHPPRSTIKESNIRTSNLDPITEESRNNYSRYSPQHTDEKDFDEDTEGTQVQTPAAAVREKAKEYKTRKNSISFGSDSFGKIDDVEKVFQEHEKDCHERNFLRPPPDITHESNMQSWEPSLASLNITKMSQDSYLKPLTSTPISGRFPGRFNAEVSEIGEHSKNYSQYLSNTCLNGMIKNIDMNQSSTLIAKNFQSNLRAPKNSNLIDEIRKKREASGISNGGKPQQRHQALLPLPKLPRIVEQQSLSSRPSTFAPNNGIEIAIKPEPLTHFGFVAIGEEVQSKVYVRNHSSHVLEVTPKLRCTSFKFASAGTAQIHPNTSHEFCIIFVPTECSKYRHALRFYVASSGNTYSHTLLGYGGTADVKVIEKRGLAYYPLAGVYRFVPSNIFAFEYEIQNFGDRTAFVHIVATSENGGEARNIMIKPKSFCLAGKSNNVDDPSKAKITVSIPESYLQELRRMSVESIVSATSNKKNNIFTLQVYFGDERLRQRAKKYSDEINSHEAFQGLLLTKTSFPNLHGEEAASVECDRISIQDMELLKAQTRVLTILVGDRIGRLESNSLSLRPPSSFSHRELLNDGYYIPECNVDGNSTMFTVANDDRTMRK